MEVSFGPPRDRGASCLPSKREGTPMDNSIKRTCFAAVLGALCFSRAASAATCELAIVLDESGSMASVRPSTGHTRCQDSALYGALVFNYYRCGSSTCAATTAARPVDFFIDGSTFTAFDVSYDHPANACSTIAAKRVNVYKFEAPGTFTSLTSAVVAPDGWVDLSNNTNANTVLQIIQSQQAACNGASTALADALCDIPPILGSFTSPKKKLKFLTDGGENASGGPCMGPEDADGVPPFDAASWEGKTFN